MSLVPSYDDSSDSNNSSTSDNSSDNEITSKTEIKQPKIKLPTPTFNNSLKSNKNINRSSDNDEGNLPKTTSVFNNPFIEAENTKQTILEKHVKMVETKDKIVVINGRKICWNYRKGKCRFGHNCKFAHDSDIQRTNEPVIYDKNKKTQQFLPQPSAQDLEVVKNDSFLQQQQNKQKRKRPGLTQGLIPGKKVMKNYAKQKL